MREIVLGIVADTHVPDWVANLHPGLIPAFRAAGVSQILHAGDISTQTVIDELNGVAPVTAVQGNRDAILNGNRHPMTEMLDVMGVKIGLMHGFGNWRLYFVEKLNMLRHGYQLSYYEKLAVRTFPTADVYIFGHTHKPENVRLSGKLFFNPGSAGVGGWGFPPSYGILRVLPGQVVGSEIIELKGAVRSNRLWVAN